MVGTTLTPNFRAAFQRYIYGPTSRGNYGLPHQLHQLQEHGLTGVFFVEPLFSTRFGLDPLAEIVGLVRERGHEIQLHLHTEWVDESNEPLLDNVTGKKQFLRYFSLQEQTILIQAGAKLIELAGGRACKRFSCWRLRLQQGHASCPCRKSHCFR